MAPIGRRCPFQPVRLPSTGSVTLERRGVQHAFRSAFVRSMDILLPIVRAGGVRLRRRCRREHADEQLAALGEGVDVRSCCPTNARLGGATVRPAVLSAICRRELVGAAGVRGACDVAQRAATPGTEGQREGEARDDRRDPDGRTHDRAAEVRCTQLDDRGKRGRIRDDDRHGAATRDPHSDVRQVRARLPREQPVAQPPSPVDPRSSRSRMISPIRLPARVALEGYLDRMEGIVYDSPEPKTAAPTVLAALGPRLLRLAARRMAGSYSYLVPPEDTARARETLGPEPWLCVEFSLSARRRRRGAWRVKPAPSTWGSRTTRRACGASASGTTTSPTAEAIGSSTRLSPGAMRRTSRAASASIATQAPRTSASSQSTRRDPRAPTRAPSRHWPRREGSADLADEMDAERVQVLEHRGTVLLAIEVGRRLVRARFLRALRDEGEPERRDPPALRRAFRRGVEHIACSLRIPLPTTCEFLGALDEGRGRCRPAPKHIGNVPKFWGPGGV